MVKRYRALIDNTIVKNRMTRLEINKFEIIHLSKE